MTSNEPGADITFCEPEKALKSAKPPSTAMLTNYIIADYTVD